METENKKEKTQNSKSVLNIKDRDIVVPGQVLAEGMDFLPSYGTYRLENKILANKLGLVTLEGKVIKTIPLAGQYLPKRNDVIVGRVIDVMINAWRLDINSAYSAVLSSREVGTGQGYNSYPQRGKLSKLFQMNDYIFCKVTNVSSQNLIDLTTNGPGLRKLKGGRVINVGTHKVPRIIGKKGSMVNMIKQVTDCKIVVGQNGVVWIQAEPESEKIAVEAIRKIEKESHISGLTNRIKDFLEKKTGKTINPEVETNDSNDIKEDN
jgi:exosome complex component RRP4